MERLWGRCAGAEGLFVDPVPPPREVLTLRGCSPDGLLSDVLAGPHAPSRGLGDVCVEVFEPRADPAPVPMELIGCEPAEPLLAALRRPRRWERDRARLLVLDRHGAVMPSRTVGLAITGARPSVLGGTLIDITLTDGGDDRPSSAARPIWEKWYQGPPTKPNMWAPYDAQSRADWLDLTTRGRQVPVPRPDRSGGEHTLDGRFVTDVPGLHCAIAEALLGPGRYFGRAPRGIRFFCLVGRPGVGPHPPRCASRPIPGRPGAS
ncbi:hypothetical protein ACFWMU_36520 [Streptomyces sp. NPDC058357]|uniref:hypothetical protein n=1 Tax=unclassified Streptomyces TaxID=2593676 RepID=UPI00365A9E44